MVSRYVTTVFGYGCGLGPSQTARSVKILDRRQIAWIQAETCKGESFNDLIKWIRFGDDETLKENDRDEQRKLIKGFEFDAETVAAISPYIREHIDRFGAYIEPGATTNLAGA